MEFVKSCANVGEIGLHNYSKFNWNHDLA